MVFGERNCRTTRVNGGVLRRFVTRIRTRKTLFAFALALLLAVFLYSVGNIMIYFFNSVRAERKNQEYLQKYQEVIGADSNSLAEGSSAYGNAVENNPGGFPPSSGGVLPEEEDKFSVFYEINPDFLAFLTIPGTSLALPVVQGDDNLFYLSHGFERQSLRAGTVFMDSENGGLEAPDRNTVLYGHNMKDGSMFSLITQYQNTDFWEQCPVIVLDTSDGVFTWQVFSAYVAPDSLGYNQKSFADDTEFAAFLHTAQERSLIRTEVLPDVSDVILTLSTCAYDFKDARFVVHARLWRGSKD